MGVQRRQVLVIVVSAAAFLAYRPAAAFDDDRGGNDEAALKDALAAMSSPDERIRLDAIFNLAKTGKPEAATRLVEAFNDISPKVRQAAIRALEMMGPQAAGAVKPLLELFKKEAGDRNQVLKALVAVGADHEDVGKLVLDIAIGKKSNKIIQGADRAFAVANLSRVRAGDRAVPVLIDVAREAAKDLDMRFGMYKIALKSLEEIGSTKYGVLPALRAFRKGDGLRGVNKYHLQDAKTMADTLLRKLETAEKERPAADRPTE